MKRSDMVKQGVSVYESILDSSRGDTFEDIVSSLLLFFEDAGMLPPSCGWLSMDEMDKLYPNEDWLECDYDRKDLNIWEEEDED